MDFAVARALDLDADDVLEDAEDDAFTAGDAGFAGVATLAGAGDASPSSSSDAERPGPSARSGSVRSSDGPAWCFWAAIFRFFRLGFATIRSLDAGTYLGRLVRAILRGGERLVRSAARAPSAPA